MSDNYDAFEISPVPTPPGPDAVAPEPYRGIYAMPMFVTIPTSDLAASTDFWIRGLGFIELFSIPGGVVHLRRWAFQDILLVPTASIPEQTSALSISFSCVLSQVEPIAEACRALRPESVVGPHDTPWNTRDVEVTTPENVRVVLTGAKPFDPASEEARNFAAVGIRAPGVGTGSGVDGGDRDRGDRGDRDNGDRGDRDRDRGDRDNGDRGEGGDKGDNGDNEAHG